MGGGVVREPGQVDERKRALHPHRDQASGAVTLEPCSVVFAYSRWDGTQVGFELDADSILEEITDDLLYHGDLNNALRRMMQSGFRDRTGERLQGLRELMEKLRRRRADALEQHNLGGVYDDIAQELREIVEQEREAIDEHTREARESGDPRRTELAEETSVEHNLQLDMLPPTWPVRSASCRSTTSRRPRRHSASRSSSTASGNS